MSKLKPHAINRDKLICRDAAECIRRERGRSKRGIR